jgi:hypothetical protein
MRRALGISLSVIAIAALFALESQAANPITPNKAALATITGSVRDNRGTPLQGALISLIRDGAKRVIKETKTDSQGNFVAKVLPGRYAIRAIANGFSEVAFSSVEVRASQELVYRFNLEPIGYGKTLPERRKDREDAKWVLRSSQTRRSIFQANEGDDAVVGAVEEAQNADSELPTSDSERAGSTGDTKTKTRGVLESYFASNSYAPAYFGLNFAISAPISDRVELIFAGQTARAANTPARFEASSRLRVGDHHHIGLTAAGARLAKPIWTNKGSNPAEVLGQVSLRAIDEWIVRDGIVIVMGIDYSRFVGRSGAHAITPRIGIQYDANARTRVKAAFASGNDDGIQSVAGFEGSQVVFREQASRPIAFVDGQEVMERSHRLEFGVERVLDNNSNLEGTAFFDTTSGRGVGLLSTPSTAFSGKSGETFIDVANQEGASRGIRLVYTRRLNRMWTASAGYSFGRGQRLSASGFSNPADMFRSGFFQTAALRLGAGFHTGTQVRTVLRFSPEATVFAIDPFAGQLGVYDPSLSIQVTQELPSFGLPVRAEAVIDARNLLDTQTSLDNGEVLTLVGNNRRSVRGGISVRF